MQYLCYTEIARNRWFDETQGQGYLPAVWCRWVGGCIASGSPRDVLEA